MAAQARNTVWWPGMLVDLTRTRNACHSCTFNETYQQKTSPASVRSLDFPIQMVVADYMDFRGRQYLVMCDRYTGWTEVVRACQGTTKELLSYLKEWFG